MQHEYSRNYDIYFPNFRYRLSTIYVLKILHININFNEIIGGWHAVKTNDQWEAGPDVSLLDGNGVFRYPLDIRQYGSPGCVCTFIHEWQFQIIFFGGGWGGGL